VTSETEARREPVGALLGLARGLLMQKQVQRARNQLKRVARVPWSVEQATSLERAWLLLSDLYIQQGKQEPATELLRRVLEHNQVSRRSSRLSTEGHKSHDPWGHDFCDPLYSSRIKLRAAYRFFQTMFHQKKGFLRCDHKLPHSLRRAAILADQACEQSEPGF